jgi:SMI1 / KNR4 family (SUKH-1)
MKYPLSCTNGGITENQITDFEVFSNFFFPKEYRNFLLETNGGIPAHKGIYRQVSEDWKERTTIETFFSLEQIKESYHFLYDEISYINAVPNTRIMVIGETIGTTTACISLEGHIYLWDDDFGATFQAHSLINFFSQLIDIQIFANSK